MHSGRRVASSSSGWCEGYRIPESLRAFCKIVSLTAAKTNRMFDVSVAWVRLSMSAVYLMQREHNILGVQIQMRPVHLVEPPEQVFCCAVDVVSPRVVWEVVAQW